MKTVECGSSFPAKKKAAVKRLKRQVLTCLAPSRKSSTTKNGGRYGAKRTRRLVRSARRNQGCMHHRFCESAQSSAHGAACGG
eukprot:5702419-Pleurochrysis_carterae.AAC.1